MPAACWTDETQLLYLKGQKLWLLTFDLDEFMTPLAISLDRQVSGCQAVIDAWNGRIKPEDRPAPRGPRSVEEINHIRARVREVTNAYAIAAAE